MPAAEHTGTFAVSRAGIRHPETCKRADPAMPPSVVRIAQPDPPASQRWSGIVLALLVALLGGLALGGCANFNKATCKLCPGPVLEGKGNVALPFGSELR